MMWALVSMRLSAAAFALSTLRKEGRKKDIQHIGRLSNVAVIIEDGLIVTAYRADKKRLRRLRAGHGEAA